MLKVFKRISSNIFVRIGFLILLVLTVVNFFHSRFLFVEAFDSQMKIFPGAFVVEDGGNAEVFWQNTGEAFFQDLSEESSFNCFSMDNSAYIVSRASFAELLNNERICQQSDIRSFELINVSDDAEGASSSQEQDVSTSTDVVDEMNSSKDDEEFNDDSVITSSSIVNIGDSPQSINDEDDNQENEDINDVNQKVDDEFLDDTIDINKDDEQTTDDSDGDTDDADKEQESETKSVENGQVQGVSENIQDNSSDTSSDLNPVSSSEPAPKPEPVTVPDPEPVSAPAPVPSSDEVSFFDTIKDQFSLFLAFFDENINLKYAEVFAQDEASSTEDVATSSNELVSIAGDQGSFETGELNQGTLNQALLFSDFSVPFVEDENEMGALRLNLSMAATSTLEDAKIIIQTRLGDKSWQRIGQIEVNKEISNYKNKGYYSFGINGVNNWTDVDNLELRVRVESDVQVQEEDLFEFYLDALWLEVGYAEQEEGEEEEVTEEKEFELDTLSLTEDFLVGENPQFEFEFKKNRNFLARFGMSILSLISDEFSGIDINAKLKNRSETGLEEVEIPLTVKYISDGRFKLEFGDLPNNFKPGKYTLEIMIEDASINGGIPLNFSQDFTWGVLAINTNKSVYLSTEAEKYLQGERAYLQMAVLDDLGHTICDADLTLEITSPFGQVVILSTDNGEIIMNEECGPDNVIDSPDYYAFYRTDMAGSYLMRLTAQTENGEREIVDEFYVENELPFEIERVGPTRIYPWVGYSMEFYVVVNEDYKGEFVETVPASFEIPEREASFMREFDDKKEIYWNVDWKKGETYRYRYVFDAPDVSPEFYLLGKARAGEFEERRRWQIASDAEVNYVIAESIAYSAAITSASYVEVLKADASSFTGGDTYFVYVSSGISKENNNATLGEFEIRYDTNVEYSGAIEPYRSAVHDAYQVAWFDVFEQPATPVDVTFNLRSGDGASAFHTLNAQIYAINLSNLEESDWEYASSTLSHTHQAAGFNQMASTTLSDADGTKDWLVFAMEEMDINVNNRNFFGRIYDDSGSYMSYSREGENTGELLPYVIFRPFDDVVQDTTFGLEVSNEAVNSNDHLKSRIFALNLDVFQSHKTYYADTNTSVGTSWTAIGNLNSGGNYTPDSTGDQFIMTSWICDTAGTAEMDDQVLVNGSVSPSGWSWTGNPTGKQSYDTQDEIFGNIMSKENIPSTGYTINLEASGDSTSRIADEISMTVFSANLNIQMNIVADSQRRSDNVSVSNGDWSNDSTMRLEASASGGSEIQMTFYYELLNNASSTTSDTTEPVGACSSGTAFNSCSGKIWQIPVSATSTWYDLNYAYRKKITIDSSQVVSNETGFPVLATTTDANFAHTDNGGHSASSTGGDFVVTDSDGITLLNFEREFYASSSGEIVLWVKTDVSSTVNKDLYIYYGNASTTMPDLSTTTGVWDSNYKGVYHLHDDVNDSSLQVNNTTNNGSVDIAGYIGDAQDFVAADSDYLAAAQDLSQWLGVTSTLSFWVKTSQVGSDTNWQAPGISGIEQAGGGDDIFWGWIDASGQFAVDKGNTPGAQSTANLNDDVWHHVVMTYNSFNGASAIHVDGQLDDSATTETGAVGNSFYSFGRIEDTGGTPVYFDGQLDEIRVSDTIRSTNWIETEFNNQIDSSVFITYDTEEVLSAASFTGVAEIISIPDSSDGYKWQVIVFDSEGGKSAWREFNTTVPNFKLDSSPPQAPGNLTDIAITGESVTLSFGYPAVDDFFSHYEIYYKEGTSGVQLTDTEHSDSNLGNRLYGGASDTLVEGLQPDTDYVFNIWAFDYAGSVATASEITILTVSPGRARTVKFLAGRYSGDGTTGQQSDTNNVFIPFNFSLAEDNVNISNAYIVFESQVEAYSNLAGNWTGYTLAFDACQEPCDAAAFSGLTNNDTSVLAYDSSESFQVRLLFDITGESQIASYSGSGVNMEGQIGYNIERGTAANAVANAQAILVLTYTFDADSESITNTVSYPLQSSTASGTKTSVQTDDCVLDSSCPLFSYNVEIPEYTTSPGAARLSQWFSTYNENDYNNASYFYVDLNIEGDDTVSTTTVHESSNGGTQGITQRMFFNNVSGFQENTDQVLEYRAVCPSNSANYYMLGGEVFETYIASSSASEKTRTVFFPMGVVNNGHTALETFASTQVYFPENGKESGQVTVKKAWIRLISHDSASGANTFTVATRVGDNATTSESVYAYDVGGTVVKPSFNVIHLIPESEYEELENANGINAKSITVSTQNSDAVDQGGTSAELVITYSYADESEGYLTSLSVMGGQVELDPQALANTTTTVTNVPLPEADEYKTMLEASLLSSFLLADQDGSVGADYLIDTNMSTGTPTCSNAFEAGNSTAHSFVEFYKNVTSAMTVTHNESYTTCYSNDQGGDTADGGAKPNSQLIYTYQYYVPRPINVSADEQYLGDGFTAIPNGNWINESNVVLSASATDTSTSTEIDFFFELIPNSGTFTATKTAPLATCVDGTAFGSCSNLIWQKSASTSFAWYNSSWLYRKKITLNANKVVGTETDFPILATTTDLNLAFTVHGGHMASSSGADIVITESDHATVLNYEREKYASSTGEVVLWIKTDISSTTNKDIYVYYGNSSVTADLSTTTGVWDSNYKGVYHLHDDVNDSSLQVNNTTNNGSVDIAGYIGDAQDFVAADSDYLAAAQDLSQWLGDTSMLSFWVKTSQVGSDTTWQAPGISGTEEAGGTDDIFWGWIDASGQFAIDKGDSAGAQSTANLNDDAWHHITMTYNSSNGASAIYVDGQFDDSATTNTGAVGNSFYSFGRIEDTGGTPVYFDGQLDEIRVSNTIRSTNWIETEYNNQSGNNFLIFSTAENSYVSPSVSESISITAIPDLVSGYKWQVLACNDLDNCAVWQTFDLSPNFKVDATVPSAPGNLTVATSTPTSVILNFGTSTDEANFAYYKIFYKSGISGVDENDTEHTDANLLAKDYNSISSTTISNLEAYTQYVINIWAYDLAGNKISATEVVVMTGSTDHARAGSVQFIAGVYTDETGLTGLNSNEDQSFDAFNFHLAETELEIRDAYIILEGQILAYSNSVSIDGYSLAFDICVEPCTADAWNGTGTVSVSDTATLAYSESESNQVKLLLDVSGEEQLLSYVGDSENLEAQVGYRFETASQISLIANAKAILAVTYAYNSDESESYTNTVFYPLNSNVAGDSGTRQAVQADDCLTGVDCPLFSYNFTAPEVSQVQSQWYQVWSVNDSHGNNDVLAKVKIERTGVASDGYLHESGNGGTQSNLPRMIFKDIYDFQENVDENLEIRAISPGGAVYYTLGGEVAETYTASTSASTRTRTASFPFEVISAGSSVAMASASVDVYFPENGEGTGIVNVESAWFRIVSNAVTSADYYIYASSKVGDDSEGDMKSYLFNVGGSVVNPSINIVQIIASTSYSELELANASNPKTVTFYATSSNTNIGGISAELMVTYTYSSETNGYMTSVKLFGGQSSTNGNTVESTLSTANSVFPELRGVKTLYGGAIYPSYLISDSDGAMPGGLYGLDASIAQSSPSCGNLRYYTSSDSINAYAEFSRDISSALSVSDGQSYTACYSIDNTPDIDSGAKMNGEWGYTYGWVAPPTEFTESDWRWYENNDAVTPVTPKTAEKTIVNNIFVGEYLRLRLNVGITKEDMGASSQTFKLQYGAGSNCAAVGTWTDVGQQGGSELWLGYNNPEPIDGESLPSYLLSSSTVAQSYEEENPTVANPSLVPVGGYSEWDFALYNNFASSSDFCFRLVKGNGTELDDYLSDGYPRVGTAPANTAPSVASNLEQYKADGVTSITNTEWINENDVILSSEATDPNINETITLYYELKTSAGSFTTATTAPSGACVYGAAYDSCASKIWFVATSTASDFRVNPYLGEVSITGISTTTSDYKWQVLACDKDDICSSWVKYNLVTPNFRIDMTDPTIPGDLSFYSAIPTNIILSFGATSTEENFSRYRIYYREGTNNVSESDIEHDNDANLLDIDFNNATSTTITSLSAGTEYVFNIWAYDLAGNVASATNWVVGTTTSSYTQPTGIFNNVVQKTDGSGAVDVIIIIDDADNDNSLSAKLFYEKGIDCNFNPASTSQLTIDETDANVSATYGDPVADNNLEFQIGSSTGWILTAPGQNYVFSDWFSKTDVPLADETYCLGLIVSDNEPMSIDSATATRLIIIDNVAPTTPGDLSTSSKDFDSITLDFGSASSDRNFDGYKMFYIEGLSGVTDDASSTEHADANLLDPGFNGATSTEISGLLPNTWYTFNIFAYDTKGNTASATEISIKTNAKPTNITASEQYKSNGLTVIPNTAWTDEAQVKLKASVHDQDISDYVTFYYELLTNAGTFTSTIGTPGNTCTTSVDYVNCASKIWEVSTTTYSLPVDWYHNDWLYRKKLTINANAVVSNESGFVVLATTTDSDLVGVTRSDGYDVLFTDSSGTTGIPFEREYFDNTNGELVAWIKTDISSTTDTEIYIYYGNQLNETDFSTTTGVWGTNYAGVWHLGETVVDESSELDAHIDSSGSGNHGTQNSNNEVAGYIGVAQEMDGSDFISIADNTSLDLTDQITLDLWLTGAPILSTSSVINKNTDTYYIKVDSSDNVYGYINGQEASSSMSQTWHQVSLSYDRNAGGATEMKLYVDGVIVDTVDYSTVIVNNNSSLYFGDYFNGLIDEVHISDVARTSDWIKTNYNNQSSVANFVTYASEEKVVSYYESMFVINIDETALGSGYKWQVSACDDDGDCSDWDKFNLSIPNFSVDTITPTSPGQLSEFSKTSSNITLSFGAATTELNFTEYKIYYSTTSPVTENDYLYSTTTDANLGYKDYNSASTAIIDGLIPDTAYYFNIWAYDVAGHSASSTITTITTSPSISSPGAIFYTAGTRVLYYQIWDGTDWGTEQTGPTLGSATGDNIRHIETLRSDDGGKIAILVKTHDGTSQEWWGTVYYFAADSFDTATQLGATYVSNTNAQLITSCLGTMSGKEFMIVRTNNGANGTLVYSWNSTNSWVDEGAGPDPSAILNGCRLVRRPGTDNHVLMTFDDTNDVGSAYYYGGSTYANTWTTWTQHSATEEDADNYTGEAFFDPSDNTRGALSYSNSTSNNYVKVKYFVASDSSINYGAEADSPSLTPDDWGGDFVHGDFIVDPMSTGTVYYLGRDNTDDLNVYQIDITNPLISWSTTTNGDDMSGGDLYLETNDVQKPFAGDFYREDKGLVTWVPNTSPSYPQYRLLDATTNSVDSSSTAVPDSTQDRWTRVKTYADPNEDEVILIYQNDNVDYAAVFFEGGNDRFYNTTDHPASNQVWTVLVAASSAGNINDENFSFSYASFNSPPNSPSSMAQLKLDGSTVIANQGWTNENTVDFKVLVTDNDTEEHVKVYLELLANNDTFTASTTEPINFCATSTYFMDCNSKIWLIGSSTLSDYSVTPFTAEAQIGTTSDSTIGYKWRVISCDDDNECSAWTNFNAVQPNYYVDTITPSTPGALTVATRDSDSVTLTFGAQGSDLNFYEYKIFYKESSGGITESDSEWSQVDDSNLGSETYGGAGSTVVTGLSSSTLYFFNIWVYDLAGNTASATPEVSTTTADLPNIVQTSYLWENDDGSDVDSNSNATTTYEVDLSNEEIGERMNLRIQVENNGGDTLASKVYELQFENQTDSPGTWLTVGAATEISYSAGLAGSNGDAITIDKANTNTNTWVDGTWHEGSAETAIYSLDYDSYTEFVFALETSNALAGKTYRFRLYNQTDSDTLNTYTNYASLITVSASVKRYSKENIASLPTTTADIAYYYDPGGYEAMLADDGAYDSLSATDYPVNFFAVKHSNNTDAITASWNGQTNLTPSTNSVILQVYKYGSPNEWLTIDTDSTTGANIDFDLSASLNSSLSSYYGASNWTYFRVYQENGTEIILSDYFNLVFSAPVAVVEQLHYRWRDDDGSETTASWRELEDQGDPLAPTVNIDVDEVIRLRLEFANTGAGTASNYNFDLEYSTSTGDCALNTYWESVTIDYSGHWNMGTSTNVSGREVSTAQLSNSEVYTFVAGNILENTFTASDNITLAESRFTEVEYVLSPTNNSVTAATYCFRGNDSGSQLDSYDVYPVITLAGNTNNAPYFSVYPSDGGSASTSVTAYGSDITFTATALDDDDDDYYLAICKTNSITAGTDAPPSCTAGDWCISSSTASSTEATCDYTAAEATEMNVWYAFVCDKISGFGIAKCSASSQGQATVENNSPFVINHPPVFSVMETVVDDQAPGSTFILRATADDPDSYGGDDTLTLYVCDTDSATWSGCDNVTLCAAASSSDPFCNIVDTAPSPPDTMNYYAFVFDSHSLAAQDNSRASSYTISNVAPSLGTLLLNVGSDITLNMKGAGDTAISTINSSVVDLNGCQSLVSATAVVYMSNATNGSSCSADDNDCYQIVVGSCVISDCSGASDTEATYTCSSALKYFASPTDDFGNNPNEPQNWLSYINVYDGTNYSATTSLSVELETTLALEVPEILIDFGSSMSVGEDTGSNNATTTVENAGNCPIDTNLSGTDMNGNPSGTIDVDNVKWSLNGGFEYSVSGTPLTTGSTLAEINAPKATTTNDVMDDVYWGIGIPFGTDRSAFTGQNSFQVVVDSDGW